MVNLSCITSCLPPNRSPERRREEKRREQKRRTPDLAPQALFPQWVLYPSCHWVSKRPCVCICTYIYIYTHHSRSIGHVPTQFCSLRVPAQLEVSWTSQVAAIPGIAEHRFRAFKGSQLVFRIMF